MTDFAAQTTPEQDKIIDAIAHDITEYSDQQIDDYVNGIQDLDDLRPLLVTLLKFVRGVSIHTAKGIKD
jgi:hypothetical protein